ncbi:predicted protein [Nematostella vectensis]|uniref:Uncharacterized protein n=1 Tax=Nematostella vectensis TaxID=45351 RepID=A7SSW7_NEMVE|nr:predicted protein [Nematostella vectensis]|eukprot:XP_001625326.1 predicted protein [Nematostella vectensis]
MSSAQARLRATSAGYRFPEATWRNTPTNPSMYHEKCTPKSLKERVKSAPPRTFSEREYARCDVVKEDEIWKNQCRNEGKMTRKWEENWGFLKDFDPKGRPKPKKELPAEVSVFSKQSPNTTNQHIGRRVKSAPARSMQRLERLTDYRIRRNKELLISE